MNIRPFQSGDEAGVIDVWRRCDLLRPWNDQQKDIRRKLKEQPEGLLVAADDGGVRDEQCDDIVESFVRAGHENRDPIDAAGTDVVQVGGAEASGGGRVAGTLSGRFCCRATFYARRLTLPYPP